MRWDLFCRVIDNHGDAGVCWRLAAELARRGDTVRLWIDDPSMLAWMAPQGAPQVQVLAWDAASAEGIAPADAVIEAFGCDPPAPFLSRMAEASARGRQPPWLNLEYLSAEPYVERTHGLASPVNHGPAAGLVKHFFYPGFTSRTGGLLREADWPARRRGFDRAAWLRHWKVEPGRPVFSLFCYEPPALDDLLRRVDADWPDATLLVTAGRATAAVQRALGHWTHPPTFALRYLPLVDQREFDALLWACDLNFVRGEDSVVRALLAGAPFVWQLYPQEDGAHLAKLEAFLGWLAPPASLAEWHRAWNGAGARPPADLDWPAWRPACAAAAARAWALPELGQALRQFGGGHARI